MVDVDVAVVGGGPAGTVAARCLASWGRRVAVLERSRYAEPRYGETLPPEAMPLLDALGLRGELACVETVESPGTVSSWGGDPVETDFVRNVHGAGLHVDRTAFDRALAHAAEGAGASLSTDVSVTGVAAAHGGWRVTTSHATLTARFVVDAAGRNSHVVSGRRTVHSDKLLALTALVHHRRGRPSDLRTYVEATPRGWWYTAPVGDRKTVSMFFTDAEEHRRGMSRTRELEDAPLTRSRVAGAEVVEQRVLPVRSGLRGRVAGPGWIAVGDSASSYDPVSGAGIYKALGQGALAAAAVHAALEGDAAAPGLYAARVRADFERYADERRLVYAAERRWAGAGFWERRRRAGGAA